MAGWMVGCFGFFGGESGVCGDWIGLDWALPGWSSEFLSGVVCVCVFGKVFGRSILPVRIDLVWSGLVLIWCSSGAGAGLVWSWCISSIYLSICLFICLSVCLSVSVYPSIHPSIYHLYACVTVVSKQAGGRTCFSTTYCYSHDVEFHGLD